MRRLVSKSIPIILIMAASVVYAKPDVRELTSRLKSSSAKVRAQAALLLGGMRAKSAVYFLVDCLKDREGVVRGTCARALGMIGDDRGLRGTAKLGADPDPFVRKWAKWAVKKMIRGDTEFDVSIPEPHGGTSKQRIAVLDGMSRALLGMPDWNLADEMDFSDDNGPSIEGMGGDPAPRLTFQANIHPVKSGLQLKIRAKIEKTPVSGTKCKIQGKAASNMDALIRQAQTCLEKFIKTLIHGGGK